MSTSKELVDENIEELEEKEEELKKKAGSFNKNLRIKILKLDADEKVKTSIYEMYMDLQSLNPSSSEYSSLMQKIVWAVNLPHRKLKLPKNLPRVTNKSAKLIRSYCSKIYTNLDSKLYGMKSVKERMIHIVNNRIYNPQTKFLTNIFPTRII